MDKSFKHSVYKRKLYKAVVRKIPYFMTLQQFNAGFVSKLEIPYVQM